MKHEGFIKIMTSQYPSPGCVGAASSVYKTKEACEANTSKFMRGVITHIEWED